MFFGCFCNIMAPFNLIKHKFLNLTKLQLSNHTGRKAMHNMSAHQLPLYYKPLQLPSMAWTSLIMWYTHHKLAYTKYCKIFLANLIWVNLNGVKFQNKFCFVFISTFFIIFIFWYFPGFAAELLSSFPKNTQWRDTFRHCLPVKSYKVCQIIR